MPTRPLTSEPMSRPDIHEAAPSGESCLSRRRLRLWNRRWSSETSGCLADSARPRSKSARVMLDGRVPVAHQDAVFTQHCEQFAGRRREEFLHLAVVQRHPLGVRAGHADQMFARFERAVGCTRAPSSCVSSPRMTSGAPSGFVQRMPGTMLTPLAHDDRSFRELVDFLGTREIGGLAASRRWSPPCRKARRARSRLCASRPRLVEHLREAAARLRGARARRASRGPCRPRAQSAAADCSCPSRRR